MDTRGAAIWMPDWYRQCKRAGAVGLSGLSMFGPGVAALQVADYIWPGADRHHPALSQSFDVGNAGTAAYVVAVLR